MNALEALGVLGLDPTATFEEMRSAYRDLLMQHHPDHAGVSGDNTTAAEERTTSVIAAFRFLREATAEGTRPLPAGLLPVLGSEHHPVVLLASPGDVFARLLVAVEEVGEISFIDRESEILGATINVEGFAASQLSAEVIRSGGDPEVQFTLETLGTGTPPDLASVVQRIAPHL